MSGEARHLVITGQVQRVGFRWSMVREAMRLGATGWVRNQIDGSVEALVCGEPVVLASMIAWARHGPPAAAVTHVSIGYAEGNFADFQQRGD